MTRINSIQDVVENHLCCGCGICAYICPDSIKMVDDIDAGRRPLSSSGGTGTMDETDASQALRVCPGIDLTYGNGIDTDTYIEELLPEWGPVREVLEGYASDPEFRHAGSSGGIASTLALFGIERQGMHGVLHIAARPDIPYLNHTVLSRSRDQILSRTGSRYAPASPCDGLRKIEDAPQPCIVIGKPCDIAAIHKARMIRPELDRKIGLTISIFCAATPSTRGTLAVIDRLGINDTDAVRNIRYRGNGWPGNFRAEFNSGEKLQVKQMTYAESWDKTLCRYRQWRCNLCVDHTGEFADISVGDPWYREVEADDPGRSLILVRTRIGQTFLDEAAGQNYLTLRKAEPGILPASQPNLLAIRRSVWGRLAALRLAGAATPKITGLPLFGLWLWRLPFRQKLQSTIGTIKRVFRYKLRKRRKVQPFAGASQMIGKETASNMKTLTASEQNQQSTLMKS